MVEVPMDKRLAYLDTSSWNKLHAEIQTNHIKPDALHNFRVMFSSNILDELVAIDDPKLRKDIAKLTRDICYPWPFNHHIQMMAIEVLRWHEKTPLKFADYLLYDNHFRNTWQAVAEGLPGIDFVATLASNRMAYWKDNFKAQLLAGRDMHAVLMKQLGVETGMTSDDLAAFRGTDDLPKAICEDIVNDQQHLREWAKVYLPLCLGSRVPIDRFDEVDLQATPCLRVGAQYYCALTVLAASRAVKKPNRGDLGDSHHAVYAGAVDYLVTEDAKLKDIIQNYLVDVPAEVCSLSEVLSL